MAIAKTKPQRVRLDPGPRRPGEPNATYRARRLSEQDFMNALLVELCRLPRTRAHRRNTGKLPAKGGWVKVGTKGMADIWGVAYPGVHFEVECKIAPEKPTTEQAAWLAHVRDTLGGVAVLATARPEQTPEEAAKEWAIKVWDELQWRRAMLRGMAARGEL